MPRTETQTLEGRLYEVRSVTGRDRLEVLKLYGRDVPEYRDLQMLRRCVKADRNGVMAYLSEAEFNDLEDSVLSELTMMWNRVSMGVNTSPLSQALLTVILNLPDDAPGEVREYLAVLMTEARTLEEKAVPENPTTPQPSA